MKKVFYLIALCLIAGAAVMTSCQKAAEKDDPVDLSVYKTGITEGENTMTLTRNYETDVWVMTATFNGNNCVKMDMQEIYRTKAIAKQTFEAYQKRSDASRYVLKDNIISYDMTSAGILSYDKASMKDYFQQLLDEFNEEGK